jgi:hypothetical protein
MLILPLLLLIWLVLMLRSGLAEYQYYQSVKTLEPQIWEQLGSPKWLKIPMVFISPKNEILLKGIANVAIQLRAQHHRRTGRQFLVFIVLALILAIGYLNLV